MIVFSAVVALAAVTQAITGFGFTLFALGTLGLWMDLREASVMLAPAGLAMNLMLFLRLRRHLSWHELAPLFISALLCVPFGTLLLLHVNLRVLEAGLALVMLATALQGLRRRTEAPRPWHPLRAGIPCGILGGLLSGAFGTGGPPVVLYFLHRPIDRFAFVASIQALFGATAAVRVTHFALEGEFTAPRLHAIPAGIVAAAVGVLVGVALLRRLTETHMRSIVLWFVLACGLRYLWAAIVG